MTPKIRLSLATTHAQAAIAAAHTADDVVGVGGVEALDYSTAHQHGVQQGDGRGRRRRGRCRLLPGRRDGQPFGCQPDDEDVVVEGATLILLILRGGVPYYLCEDSPIIVSSALKLVIDVSTTTP